MIARCVGLDGWHFSRAHLDTMPDPETAHFRRVSTISFTGVPDSCIRKTRTNLVIGSTFYLRLGKLHALRSPPQVRLYRTDPIANL